MDTKEQVAVLEAARLINDFAVLPRAVVLEKYGIATEEQRRFKLTAASGRVLEFVTGRINEMADQVNRMAAIPEEIKPGKEQKKPAKRRGRPPKPRPAAGEKKKSIYKGVTWSKREGRWCVQVTVGGKYKCGGLFDDELKAAARAAELRGDTAEAVETDIETAKEKMTEKIHGKPVVFWQCRSCGWDVGGEEPPVDAQCPKCDGASFEKITQPENPRKR